jgi:phosphoglycerate transporter family protein
MPASPLDSAAIDRRYRHWRVRVMYTMMIGYAVFYFVRTNLSMAAKAITDEFGFSNTQWGLMLTISTIVYAVSKFLSGVLADVIRPKYIMATGLVVSAAINLVFGLGHTLAFFTALWTANNLFQGMGMPPCSRLLTRWFSPREIGRAWGVWNASHQIGGAIVAVGGGYLVGHFGWRSIFWVPGIIAIGVGVWLFCRLPDSPESMGLPPVETYRKDGTPIASEAALPFKVVFRDQILRNPWVWVVSIANFFVYIVRIGVLSWGPKYLQEAKGFTVGQAGWIQGAFEAAGIFGAILAGWLSDRVFRGRRGPVSVLFMILLAAAVGALLVVPRGHIVIMGALFASLGFFVYGPQLLVAVAAADFATKPAAASAVGLTGLFGYLGAAVCGTATGWLVDHVGWNGAVWFYLGAAAIGAGLLATTWNRTTPALAGKEDFR